jgi:hypothetical protein
MNGLQRLRHTLVLAVAALSLFSATSLTAQEVLTNESLVALKKAGLSDSIIISKIRSSQTKFDVSTKGLIGLKNAGLSDQVIEAVVNAGSATTPPAAPAAAAPAAPAAAAAPGRVEGNHRLSGRREVRRDRSRQRLHGVQQRVLRLQERAGPQRPQGPVPDRGQEAGLLQHVVRERRAARTAKARQRPRRSEPQNLQRVIRAVR